MKFKLDSNGDIAYQCWQYEAEIERLEKENEVLKSQVDALSNALLFEDHLEEDCDCCEE